MERSKVLQLNCKADLGYTRLLFPWILIFQPDRHTHTSSSPHEAAGPFLDHLERVLFLNQNNLPPPQCSCLQ